SCGDLRPARIARNLASQRLCGTFSECLPSKTGSIEAGWRSTWTSRAPLRRKRPPNQVPMAIQADVSYCGGIASNFRSLPSGANVTCSSTDRLSLNDQLAGPDFLSLYPDFLSLYIGSELISFQLPTANR